MKDSDKKPAPPSLKKAPSPPSLKTPTPAAGAKPAAAKGAGAEPSPANPTAAKPTGTAPAAPSPSKPAAPTGNKPAITLSSSGRLPPVTKLTSSKPTQELSPGELREELQVIETEILEYEKHIQFITELKAENAMFNNRMKNLHRAVYGLLFLASHPTESAIVKKHIAVLTADYELFQNSKPGEKTDEFA